MLTFIQWTKLQNQPGGLTKQAAASERERIKEKLDRQQMTSMVESFLKELIERRNVDGY